MWKEKLQVCRDFTSECVKQVPDSYFDFIYLNIRIDFNGVYQDLTNWWPKLKKDGIMAGHNYITIDEFKQGFDGTYLAVNIDDTDTVVKGAVDKFASEFCRQVTISYRESKWNTWAMRK